MTNETTTFEVFTSSEFVEDRSNTEMYDLDGWPTRIEHFVIAENPYGTVFRHHHRFETRAEAEALAYRVNGHLASFPDWYPGGITSGEYWELDRPAYGSPAWELAEVNSDMEWKET